MNTLNGYSKSTLSDLFTLTASGGHFPIHEGRNNEKNKLVRTDASGYILAGWINTLSGDMGTTAATRIYCSNDGYIRYKTLANFSSDIAKQLYWANVKVSTSSNAATNPEFNKVICNYKSGTWVNSLTESAISLPDASGSYGGWICGPTNAGRIAISTYQASNNHLYFGYGERGRTTNSFATSMYWDGPSNCLYAAHFYEISDIRLKDIKSRVDISTKDLAKLPLFNFTWNNQTNDILYSGTSAQDVLKILPTVVSYTEEHYQLDYATLGTIAGITACKELVAQKSEIELLKDRIELLEQQLKMYHGNSK